MRALLLSAAVAAGLAGCATSRAPLMKMADARGEIRAAEQLNADAVAPANNYLLLARQEEEQGRQYLNAGQEIRAGYMLERAQADAELALSLATEAPARAEAERAIEQVKQLQSQTQTPATEVKP
jgi:hypothetical protein